MRERLYDWLDARTGVRSLVDAFLKESIPGGARWRFVFGPTLAVCFLIQLVTGLLLMTSYVPSASQAWGSVWYIQTQMVMGWFIRGLHHFGSSAVMVLLLLHLCQVVFTRAYRSPREINWWLGLAMAGLILGLALTGYLLPWDMKGYWATKVATNIAGSTPGIGPAVLTLIVGGSEYGNLTLTRLFSLHVGFLPLGILALLAIHVRLYYRHGASAPETADSAQPAWPFQVFRNLVAIVVAVGAVIAVVLWNHGVGLEAPADPSVADFPARPEWYFLPLFQLLNYFQSPYEVIGTHVLPGFLFGFLAALPLLDRWLPRRLVYVTACLIMVGVVCGAGFLMTVALRSDRENLSFQLARTKADIQRRRADQLAAAQGVPPDGAIYILRRDPWTHGREVLDQSCLSCHYYGGKGRTTRTEYVLTAAELAGEAAPGGAGVPGLSAIAAASLATKLPGFRTTGSPRPERRGGWDGVLLVGTNAAGERSEVWVRADGAKLEELAFSPQTASDLEGFGSRTWIRGLLANPSDSRFFGSTPNLKGMQTWKKKSKLTPAQLDQVADFVVQLGEVEDGETVDKWYEDRFAGKLEEHPGAALFVKDCGTCHVIGEPGLISEGGLMEAPDLFAYGSHSWLVRMIRNPGDPTLYEYLDEADRMPAFEDQLSDGDLDTLIRYLKGDYLSPETPSVAESSRPEPAPVPRSPAAPAPAPGG